MVEFDGGIAE